MSDGTSAAHARRVEQGTLRLSGRFPLTLMVLVAVAAGLFVLGSSVSAQSATLRIDPPSQSVGVGQSFTVSIVQSADFASLGAAATLQFDPSVVQVTGGEVGQPYADALFLFGSGAAGSGAQTPEQAIAEANTTGLLANITTFLLPGTGSVPPGDAVVATISMSGKGGGTSALNLVTYAAPGGTDANSLGMVQDPPDPQGNLVPVSVAPGEVTVTGGGAVAATSAVAAASATPAASETPKPLTAKVDPNASATLTMSFGSDLLTVGGEAEVELRVKANVKTSGALTNISFDKSVIEIVKIEQGPSWKKATLTAGTGREKVEQAVLDANTTGELKSAGVRLAASGSGSSGASPSASSAASSSATPAASDSPVQAGSSSPSAPAATRSRTPSASAQAATAADTFLVMTVRGVADGETELALKNATVLDEKGNKIKVTAQSGKLTVGEAGGGGGGGIGLPLLIAGGLLGVGVIGSAGFVVRNMRRRGL